MKKSRKSHEEFMKAGRPQERRRAIVLAGSSLDKRFVESYPMLISSILYVQRKITGSALI
jgi:hypothetical protein